MKTHIKKICYFAIIVFFASCESPESEGYDPKKSTRFSLVDMEYFVNENTLTDERIKTGITIHYSNGSSTEQSYPFRPQGLVSETSEFRSDDERAFNLAENEFTVIIPTDISNDGTLIFDEGDRWIYSGEEQRLNPESDGSYETMVIPPHHRLELSWTYKMRSLDVEYEAHLRGVEFGEEITVRGDWLGRFYVDYEMEYTVEPIEEQVGE